MNSYSKPKASSGLSQTSSGGTAGGIGPNAVVQDGQELCIGGRVVDRYHKCLLPTYDVFDEARYFEPGGERCANGYPTAPHAHIDLALRRHLEFCKEFEFAGPPYVESA